jgi:hypothetical protein
MLHKPEVVSRVQGPLRRVNPALNIHPYTAAPFLEPSHFAKNNNTLAVRAMPERERLGVWLRLVRINSALNVTSAAPKKLCAGHAVHSSAVRPSITPLDVSSENKDCAERLR